MHLRFLVSMLLATSLAHAGTADGQTLPGARILDSGDSTEGWTAIASPGATAELDVAPGREGSAISFSFDLGRGKTHVIARRTAPVDLPPNYRFIFEIEGDVEPNTLEIKLISGENVWWTRLPDYSFPQNWKTLPVADSRISFAWGPAGGGMPVHLDAIELAISAGRGGKGTLRLDAIRLEPRNAALATTVPIVETSSNPAAASHLFDENPSTSWQSGNDDREPGIVLDFHEPQELGGLTIDHAADGFASAYAVDVSTDRTTWTEVRSFAKSDGGTDDVYMPDVYARYARIRWTLPEGQRASVREIRIQPYEFSASVNGFFTAIARRSPEGRYPRYFVGEQSYWTLAGVSGANDEALVNEEGSVEIGAGSLTLEPFVYVDGGLRSWGDTSNSVALEEGDLPIPTVTRRDDAYSLAVTAFASGKAEAPTLYVRYRVTASRDADLRLFVALRPFQVLPPWQALNRTGGAATVARIAQDLRTAHADDRRIVAVTPADSFGAASFEEGDITAFLSRGAVPAATSVVDPFAHASAAFSWTLALEKDETRDIWLAVPWASSSRIADAGPESELAATKSTWKKALGAARIELPDAAGDWERALRSNLAYILINRDGARIQPGSRTYERSWIRDGAMTSAALLELGLDEEVKSFLRFFAQYVGEDGYVPCCVDWRGADPVPEHDSFGEFIWAVADVWRFTRDEAFVREMWPDVRAAAACMSRLRAKRMTPEYQDGTKRAFYGLLPESISHEGYSARPVHSYWDQTFALRGFADAAMLAAVVGDDGEKARLVTERDDFEKALRESIRLTMESNRLDTVPASVELADFDPTSTAVSFQLGLEGLYPRDALERSYEKYARDLRDRRGKRTRGVGYTAYELRNATALVSLGRPRDAVEMLAELVADTRPRAWNAWPEISWLDHVEPSFLGDLPHTWIGSSFVHAVRSLLVTETGGFAAGGATAPEALLVASGVPLEWVDGRSSVRAPHLPTWYGPISLEIGSSDGVHAGAKSHHDTRPASVFVKVAAVDSSASHSRVRQFTPPEGGILVRAPFGENVLAATVNGVGAVVENSTVSVRQLPATVVFQYKPRLEGDRDRVSGDESRRGGH